MKLLRLAMALAAVLAVVPAPAQTPAVPPPSSRAQVWGYQMIRSYPHDAGAFTQGLEYVDGFLYEGTGLNGRSSIRKVKLDTGGVLLRRDVGQQHFGEGITLWKSSLIELTWKSNVAFVYDKATFQPRGSFKYS